MQKTIALFSCWEISILSPLSANLSKYHFPDILAQWKFLRQWQLCASFGNTCPIISTRHQCNRGGRYISRVWAMKTGLLLSHLSCASTSLLRKIRVKTTKTFVYAGIMELLSYFVWSNILIKCISIQHLRDSALNTERHTWGNRNELYQPGNSSKNVSLISKWHMHTSWPTKYVRI